MRILTPIILPQALLMNRVQTKSLFRGTIRGEFVGHDRRRRKALPLQELAHQPFYRSGIPATLDQEIQDLALAVDGPLEIEPPPSHHDHHLVEIPAICWPMSPMSDAAGIGLAKLEALCLLRWPATNGKPVCPRCLAGSLCPFKPLQVQVQSVSPPVQPHQRNDVGLAQACLCGSPGCDRAPRQCRQGDVGAAAIALPPGTGADIGKCADVNRPGFPGGRFRLSYAAMAGSTSMT